MKSVIYLWHSRALIFGVPVNAAPHSHHALQLSIGLDEEFRLRCGQSKKQERMSAALIGANVGHCFDDTTGSLVNLYLDPESQTARQLAKKIAVKSYLKIEHKDIEPFLPSLQESWGSGVSCPEVFALNDDLLHAVFQTKKTETVFDPRIERALEILRNAPDNLISAETVAGEIALSPSRFAHLFRSEVGLPVRRYLMWLRLRNAVRMLGNGDSLTTVAHAAGFADSAHLTRTFKLMFGIAPSDIFQNSRFVQVNFCDE
jgi:AraC-like DNA-binding protein